MQVCRSAPFKLLATLAAAAIIAATGMAASAQPVERYPAKPKAGATRPASRPVWWPRPGLRTLPPRLLARPPAAGPVPGAAAFPRRTAFPPGGAPYLRGPGGLPATASRPGTLTRYNTTRQFGFRRPTGQTGLRQSPAVLRRSFGRPNQPGLAKLRGPGLRQSSLPRPRGLLPGGARPTRLSAGSAAWAAMRQRYYVAPPRSPGPPPGAGIGRTRSEMSFSGVPPRSEARFVPSEVVVQVANTVPQAQVETAARQLGMTMVASQRFDAGGRTLYRFRSAGGRDVRDVIRQLEQDRIVASAQPNYVYKLDQSAPSALQQPLPVPGVPSVPTPSSAAAHALPTVVPLPALPAGDPTQYTIQMLHLVAAHRQALGRNVSIAVIDSEIDQHHPDLQGAIKEHFDPTGIGGPPDLHGTGMAGAIVAKYHLLGVAPEATIVAIKAFDVRSAGTEATSFQILKALEIAMQEGVRIINMSFAGPYDVMMERKLQEAYDKGIVLVAAAGNAGPKSPPLYPAADPNVIAVTATDKADHPFAMANRGNYIAIAAPGVDILAPAPGAKYQLTTGTSVAAAHVSGVIALMLEKRPELTPDDVRVILANTADPIAGAAEDQAGAGLIDPLKALNYQLPAASSAQAPHGAGQRPQTAGQAAQ